MKSIVIIFLLALTCLIFQDLSIAGETECLVCYSKKTEAIEDAAIAAQAKLFCRAKDRIAEAMYWLEACKEHCAYSQDRLEMVTENEEDLLKVLDMYTRLCNR